MSFILSLDTDTFIDLLGVAVEKETEDKLWEKFLHDNTDLTFNQYKDKHFKTESKKSDDEILQDAANILKSMSKR